MLKISPIEYPWLTLNSYEISRSEDNALLYERMAAAAGEQAMYVPAFVFCGAMITGWDAEETTGAVLKDGLEQCHTWVLDNPVVLRAVGGPPLRANAAGPEEAGGTENTDGTAGMDTAAEGELAENAEDQANSAEGIAAAEDDAGQAPLVADETGPQAAALGMPMTY